MIMQMLLLLMQMMQMMMQMMQMMLMATSSNLFNITIDNDVNPGILHGSLRPTRDDHVRSEIGKEKTVCFLTELLMRWFT